MGQFLAIGIVTKQIISKQELQKGKITIEELVAKMQNELHFNSEIYDFVEDEKDVEFILKNDVFEKELLPFLEKFYPMIYVNSKSYLETIQELKSTKSDQWIAFAEDKSCEEFQMDDYGTGDNLYFDKDFQPRVKIFNKSILLSLEGKIMMESYGRQFNFFKLCMTEMFKEFKLAGALRVYITG